jgi:hypothetical protein
MTQHDEALLAIASAFNRIAEAIEKHTVFMMESEQRQIGRIEEFRKRWNGALREDGQFKPQWNGELN